MNDVACRQLMIESKRERIKEISAEIDAIVDELRGSCDHAGAVPYTWEHDNGYGRQTMINGKRCVYCGWVDHWNDGRWIGPAARSVAEKSE